MDRYSRNTSSTGLFRLVLMLAIVISCSVALVSSNRYFLDFDVLEAFHGVSERRTIQREAHDRIYCNFGDNFAPFLTVKIRFFKDSVRYFKHATRDDLRGRQSGIERERERNYYIETAVRRKRFWRHTFSISLGLS